MVVAVVVVVVVEQSITFLTPTLTTYQILSSVGSTYPTRNQKLEEQQAMPFAMT